MEEQSRAEFNRLEQACISKSHELREVEEQLARMTVEKEVLETDVQAAEDRCAQLQHLCAEVKCQLDELGETKARKEAELAAANSRLQSVQSLVLAEIAKLLAAQSAVAL
jgi:DNA repair ATPase RecN